MAEARIVRPETLQAFSFPLLLTPPCSLTLLAVPLANESSNSPSSLDMSGGNKLSCASLLLSVSLSSFSSLSLSPPFSCVSLSLPPLSPRSLLCISLPLSHTHKHTVTFCLFHHPFISLLSTFLSLSLSVSVSVSLSLCLSVPFSVSVSVSVSL